MEYLTRHSGHVTSDVKGQLEGCGLDQSGPSPTLRYNSPRPMGPRPTKTVRSARRIDAVIFDMDGVLADSEPLHLAATRDVLAPYGVPDTAADAVEFFGTTDPEMFATLRARHPSLPDPAALTAARAQRVLALLADGPPPLPGVPQVPRMLRARYRLALASSSDAPIIAATLVGVGLADGFDAVVSGHEVPRSKPAPDVFLEAARRLGVGPAACAVIEDSPNGLAAARAAGMLAIAVPCAATARLPLDAHHRLESLLELDALLAELGRGAP